MSDVVVSNNSGWKAYLKRVAPYFLVGPISGPLLERVVFNLRAGRPVRASLYGLALVEYVILLPTVTAHMAAQLGHRLFF